MAIDKSFRNVIHLGLAFMLIFTAFQTMGNIQKSILNSVHEEDSSFNGDGYVSLSIIYAVFSVCNWLAPSVINLTGPRFAIFYGAVTYLFFIMTFLMPKDWLLYLASAVIGTGAALIWTGQGNYLTLNSSKATMSRNSGVFWAMLQFSMFAGNVFVFIKFKGKDKIEKSTRTFVIWTLSAISVVGLVVAVLLPRAPKVDRSENDNELPAEEAAVGPVETLKKAVKLFCTKNMLLLSITFSYTGLELGFFSGVYSSCLGFTESFEDRKELIGLSGILIGLGEVIGGATFGILGSKTNKWGRDPIVIGGFVLHVISYFLIFLNIPNASPFGDTSEDAFITSIPALALFCSFLLGLGDACYNTQIYSMLGSVYSTNSAAAFAIFKCTQSVAAAICFGYASAVSLYGQLGALLVLAIMGTVSFVYVEWTVKREAKPTDSLSSRLELGFFSGVYSSCLGFTESFEDRKELIGLSGILIGGATFGILGSKTNKWGRDPIVIGGFVLHVISYFLIFLNIPNASPFGDTSEDAFITSIPALALFCSFLLGLGDACYNTQIYSMLGSVYSTNSAAAFAIFKCTQSVAAAICFGYAPAVSLYGQLGALLVLAIMGTVSFVYVEWTVKREAKPTDSLSSSNESISE